MFTAYSTYESGGLNIVPTKYIYIYIFFYLFIFLFIKQLPKPGSPGSTRNNAKKRNKKERRKKKTDRGRGYTLHPNPRNWCAYGGRRKERKTDTVKYREMIRNLHIKCSKEKFSRSEIRLIPGSMISSIPVYQWSFTPFT